ncbi:MAG: TonB-dependent receptor [Burkholderiaceae bacterium]|nr:TonB-dependent receptor [Burkholderiaceae bacterium]
MPRFPSRQRALALAAASLGPALQAQTTLAADTSPTRASGVVVVTGVQPSSLPTRIPTTIESVTRDEIERTINASDSEDALKYLPSLLVRKRYIGDYNHAVLSTRASGTGNSARSLVYADGVLLSNLLGNGANFAPRWGMVTPEEIERVDVLYGPFSAAYAGNSVGAVVDYVTRMPQRFEAHGKVGASRQHYELYGRRDSFDAWQTSASLGDRAGAISWWLDVSRLDSHGQPLTFATRLASAGTPLRGGETAVTGAVLDKNRSNQDWYLLASGTEYSTVQDHLKAKLAWDLTPELRASYLGGLSRNDSTGVPATFLRDGAGRAVDNTDGGGVAQPVAIAGRRYTLAAADFPRSDESLAHQMHALNLKSRRRGVFDWELSASLYDYGRDLLRAYAPSTAAQPQAGRITDMAGTGWQTLAAKGVWRPAGGSDEHVVDAGIGQDSYRLRSRVDSTGDWLQGAATAFSSRFEGQTRLQSLFAQDAWRLSPDWTAVLGLRAEHWTAWGGLTESAYGGSADRGHCSAASQRCTLAHPERSQTDWSPKAALSFQLDDERVLKASTGRALRYPTVSELYQGGINAQGQAINNNPDLRPETSWTSELSAEWTPPRASVRATLFHEDTRDALYAQLNTATNANTVQNVDRIRTTGLELAASSSGGWTDALLGGLSLQGSLTYANSKIVANAGHVAVPGDTIGKWQPRVPRWRASALGSWQATPQLSLSLGARYSGDQYSTLDNSDPNGFAYQGASKYFTTDLRALWQITRQWSLAAGIDNLNDYHYWNFHPYPQRTATVELKFDL